MAAREGQVTARDEEFAALVERQARLMFRVAYSLLRNVQDAEDAVQEAFLKLYRGEAWRRMEDEKAFLARTVWRVALDGGAELGRMADVAEMETGGQRRSLLRTGPQVEMRERAATDD